MTIQFAETDEQLARCYPALKSIDANLQEVACLKGMKILLSEGTKIVMIEAENIVTTVACFRITHYLFRGKHLYLDYFITLPEFKKMGYSKALLNWIIDYAKQQNCDSMSLDSRIDSRDAHRLYLSVGLSISSLHFYMNLEGAQL